MYGIIKQYLIEPFARTLFGDYESQENKLVGDLIVNRRILDYVNPGKTSIDEICWNELRREAG
ncbi:MAG: hypothetical protein U9R08_05265 [Nanoarchaeota archaeon]|nr:hypothetical protein [Nanoarchaeota archaeon]